MEAKFKHLDMIQSTIGRFSANSFQLKGWSVVLVSALIALSAKEENSTYALLTIIPTLVFWGLDGYYLSIERLYRKLFEIVRKKDNSDIDFSMITTHLNEKESPWLSATFSITLVPFYGSIIISTIVITRFI